MSNKNLVICNEEEILIGLIRNGFEELQAEEMLENLNEEIEMGVMDLIAKVGETYIASAENLEFIRETYKKNSFVPVRL